MTICKVVLDGRYVGDILDGVYITHRNKGDHMYQKLLGYCIAKELLLKWKESKEVYKIRIIEESSNGKKIYEATLDKFLKGGYVHEYPFEEQMCVPIKEMNEIKPQATWNWGK